jgi:phosphofructokinase-like protein
MGNDRIGILTGGGDCPGLNAAIRATAKTALGKGYEVIGIRDGWEGFLQHRYESLDVPKTSGIIDRGGTILGTSRFSPFQTEDGPQQVIDRFNQAELRALVVLGGDGTLSAAARLHQMGLPVVGIPKTIDNDIKGTDFSIGFQTAVQIATDALDRLRSTAESHHRVMMLEVMGRRAGWIATYAGMASGADAIIIPEIPLNDDKIAAICELLQARHRHGKRFSVVVVAEGAQLQLAKEKATTASDSETEACPPGIANLLREIIIKQTGLETRVSSLSYVQRGGTPVAYDRNLAIAFGVKAVKLIEGKQYGLMAALKGNSISSEPLDTVLGGIKTVDMKIYRVAEIFFG